ncbi:MAG: 4-hydroxy-tetrahydrodipicolinate synthase [Spirochaetia bacterium]|nr:4-hydroxy-tetrahydrodipicolinate synthase [Spirochaetia bacterium]
MQFKGLYTAIVTPFEKKGTAIDYDAYAKLVELQVQGGVAGIVPCGTTGESPTLSHEEHSELIKRTVKLVSGRIQVIAGTGSNSTSEAIELTKAACADRVDAVMIVNPYYNKPTQDGLFEHFKAIASVSSVPIMVYNIKGRTGVNVEPETFVRLKAVPGIEAIKEASGDLGQMARIQQMAGDRFSMLSGDDNLTPAVMSLGGNGVVSVLSNLYPKRMSRMVAFYLAGNFAEGNKIFYSLLDIMQAIFWETNPIPIKAAVAHRGLCASDLRLPMTSMSPGRLQEFLRLLDQTGADA